MEGCIERGPALMAVIVGLRLANMCHSGDNSDGFRGLPTPLVKNSSRQHGFLAGRRARATERRNGFECLLVQA